MSLFSVAPKNFQPRQLYLGLTPGGGANQPLSPCHSLNSYFHWGTSPCLFVCSVAHFCKDKKKKKTLSTEQGEWKGKRKKERCKSSKLLKWYSKTLFNLSVWHKPFLGLNKSWISVKMPVTMRQVFKGISIGAKGHQVVLHLHGEFQKNKKIKRSCLETRWERKNVFFFGEGYTFFFSLL